MDDKYVTRQGLIENIVECKDSFPCVYFCIAVRLIENIVECKEDLAGQKFGKLVGLIENIVECKAHLCLCAKSIVFD